MRVVLPNVEFRTPEGVQLAQRPQTLDGLRVGFLDAWGHQRADGVVDMYPLMAAYREQLVERYNLDDALWVLKPSVSEPMSAEALDSFAYRVDVAINGEGA